VGADGKLHKYVAIRVDITERKRAEEVRERLAAVVESSDDAIIGKTLDGVITTWNHGAEKVFGYSSSEAVGKPMQMLVPPERANEEPDILARVERGESVEHFETVRVRKDGKGIDVSVTISPIRDSSGAIVGVSKVARDITERKHAEQRLADKAEELARSNRELEQFAYLASHDLQEPLRMVASYTQLLAERYGGKLDENADKFLGYAREGALRMQVLIRDLLAFSRVVQAGIPRKPVDCNVALEEAVQSLTAAIEESGAVVTHAALPNVWADQTQIAQVFQNLIGNAIKFHDGAPPECAVSAEKSGRNWLFSVSDNGIGIAPEYAENIFVVFQRLHARTEYPGNGMGLAICKKIIQHYGGTIWVESQVGQGSTFKFTLPAAAPEEEGRARS
jgi:PAS domain S-box-containing protein